MAIAKRFKIKQLYPAYNLKTNEQMSRAESCEILLYIQCDQPCTDPEIIQACRNDPKNVPTAYLGMRLMDLTVTERIDPKNWKATASYNYYGGGGVSSHGDKRPAEKTSIDFGTTTVRRTVSLATHHRYGKMPDYGGLIDVQESGDGALEPKGVEVYSPNGTMTITHYFKRSEWTTKLRNKIAFRRCRVNSEEFRGFEAGELLFLGESVNYSDKDGYIEVQYKFLISQNADDIEVGNMRGIKKKGWDALWVRYSKGTATAGGDRYAVVNPQGVAVEKVYHDADFSEMGLKKNEGRVMYRPTFHL